jgi:hypothetical protein
LRIINLFNAALGVVVHIERSERIDDTRERIVIQRFIAGCDRPLHADHKGGGHLDLGWITGRQHNHH